MLEAEAVTPTPELDVPTFVVVVAVAVVTASGNVVALTVVPSMVVAELVDSSKDVTATSLCCGVPETVMLTVSGYRNVCVPTLSERVEGGIVVADNVLQVIAPPRALAGIAGPTPDDVNCVGRTSVEVSGFAEGLSLYIFPLVPFFKV